MEFFFNENNVDEVLSKIQGEIDGREMGKILTFSHAGSELTITIKKLGTSTLNFDVVEKDGGLNIKLMKEKIALSHRPMKKELEQKLKKIVEKIGGSMH